MQFTSVTLLSLACTVLALPMTERQTAHPFTVISARSGSPVHLLPWAAHNLEIWLGGNSSTFCPGEVEGLDCRQFKNYTGFVGQAGSPVSIGMSTNVPGGQGLYIAPGGAIKYTQAHSGYKPDGSISQGFSYAPSGESGTVGHLAPSANGSTGFLACPATTVQKSTGPYQVFADVEDLKVPSGCKDDCLGFSALTNTNANSSVAAWQYT